MIVRHRLPNRRASMTFEFDAAGLRFVATVRFDDGNPAEIFIDSNKADSAAGVVASDATTTATAGTTGATTDTTTRAMNGTGATTGAMSAARTRTMTGAPTVIGVATGTVTGVQIVTDTTTGTVTGATTGATAQRHRLADRRAAMTFNFEVDGLRFVATVGRFDNGEIAEIFITSNKAGSAVGIMASDAAIAASLALQHGCPLEVLRKALSRDSHGHASGPLGAALDQIVEEVAR
jgi:ribonucleoside-diphosphate reductase alpha chain